MRQVLKIGFAIMFLSLFTTLIGNELKAQEGRDVIQLSGVIIAEDGASGVPGVHIYVPKAGRGTSSNPLGYFSLPVLAGDSVIISSVGYKRQHYLVEKSESQKITLIIELETDTTFLEAVEILPFPTEKMFKEALLALNLPIDNGTIQNDQLSADLLAFMLANTPMDGQANYRNYMNLQVQNQNNRFGPAPNPLLNPFNWARFFKSLKDGDFKKKKNKRR